jgi:hypothetical protein
MPRAERKGKSVFGNVYSGTWSWSGKKFGRPPPSGRREEDILLVAVTKTRRWRMSSKRFAARA